MNSPSFTCLVGHPSRPYSYTRFKEQGLFNQKIQKVSNVIPTNYKFRAFSKKRCVFGEYEETPVVNISSTRDFWLRHDAKDEDMDNVVESPIDQPLGQKLQCWNHPSIKAPACEMSWQMILSIHNIISTEFENCLVEFTWGWIKTIVSWIPKLKSTKISSYDLWFQGVFIHQDIWLPGFFIKDFLLVHHPLNTLDDYWGWVHGFDILML